MDHQRALSSLSEFSLRRNGNAAGLGDRGLRTRKGSVSLRFLCRSLIPLDALLVAVAAVAAYEAAFSSDAAFPRYAVLAAFGALLTLNFFVLGGLYSRRIFDRPYAALAKTAGLWTAVVVLIVGAGQVAGIAGPSSRFWAFAWLGFGLGGLVPLRFAVFALAARWAAQGRLGKRVAILGDPGLARRLAQHFAKNPSEGVHVAGIFSVESDKGSMPLDGDLDVLVARLRSESIDAVILAPLNRSEAELRDIYRRLSEVPVNVWLCPGGTAFSLVDADTSYFAGIPAFNVMKRPLEGPGAMVKEVEDRVLGLLITLLISPLLLGIALCIKLDSKGPVFFRQKRRGYNNEIIEVFKFRTMYHEKTDYDGDRLTQRNDPRVTRFGAVLRRWSLDELPQFLNVLRGDMSIVGPRPHALNSKAGSQYYQDAVPLYDARHRVKPGITGLAQIRGWRGPTETVRQIRMRVEHDLYYIDHWSLWLDLKIIFLTAFKGLRSENAF